jgi:hypothetical protein
MNLRTDLSFSRFVDEVDKEFHSKNDMFISLQGMVDMLAEY